MTDQTYQRLLEAAEQVFADKGFKAASVRDICARAGANVAAVNYYFGDKERLYSEAVKYAHRGCVQGAPFPEWHADTPALQKLRDFIRVMVSRMMSPQSPASLQLMMREMSQPTSACVEVVRDFIQPMAEKLKAIVEELKPEVTEQERVLIAFSIVGQCHFYRTHRAVAALLVGEELYQGLDEVRVAEHISSFTIRALGVESIAVKQPS